MATERRRYHTPQPQVAAEVLRRAEPFFGRTRDTRYAAHRRLSEETVRHIRQQGEGGGDVKVTHHADKESAKTAAQAAHRDLVAQGFAKASGAETKTSQGTKGGRGGVKKYNVSGKSVATRTQYAHPSGRSATLVRRSTPDDHTVAVHYKGAPTSQEHAERRPIMSTPYEARRHAQRHALDDNGGTRGAVPGSPLDTEAGGGAGRVGKDAQSAVPGSLPPSYETGDGDMVMSSRCEKCGVPLTPRDAQFGGTRCEECAGKQAFDKDEKGHGSYPHGSGGTGSHEEDHRTAHVTVHISDQDHRDLTSHLAQGKSGRPLVAAHATKQPGDHTVRVRTSQREAQDMQAHHAAGKSGSPLLAVSGMSHGKYAHAETSVKVRTGQPNPDNVKAPRGSAPAPAAGHLMVSDTMAMCGGKGGKPGPCKGDSAAPAPDHIGIQKAKAASKTDVPGQLRVVDENGAQHTYEKDGGGQWVHQGSGKVQGSREQTRLAIAANRAGVQ